jgi:sec-independent protein translocase protein TatC
MSETQLQPISSETPAPENLHEMTFVDHLGELRRALVISVLAVVVGSVIGFSQHQLMLDLLRRPVPHVTFNTLAVEEGLMAVLRLSIMIGIFLGLPVILREIHWFVGPALTRRQRLMIFPVVVMSYVLFTLGVCFAYLTLLPISVKFLIGFIPQGIQPMISIGRYIDFTSMLLVVTGLMFQIPIVLLVLNLLGILARADLARQRRYAYFGSFVVSALITPTVDVFTQSILAGMLILLFESGLILMAFVELLRRPRSADA